MVINVHKNVPKQHKKQELKGPYLLVSLKSKYQDMSYLLKALQSSFACLFFLVWQLSRDFLTVLREELEGPGEGENLNRSFPIMSWRRKRLERLIKRSRRSLNKDVAELLWVKTAFTSSQKKKKKIRCSPESVQWQNNNRLSTIFLRPYKAHSWRDLTVLLCCLEEDCGVIGRCQ